MQKLKILNSKEIKRLKQLLEKQFSHSFQEDYAYLENENKHKIYIVTKNIANIELEKLMISILISLIIQKLQMLLFLLTLLC